uniref:Uncharacterized protein n=1 Tax=Grammatophora oceanica TaxID=210454 RepID=A0A7S1USX8_9STRA
MKEALTGRPLLVQLEYGFARCRLVWLSLLGAVPGGLLDHLAVLKFASRRVCARPVRASWKQPAVLAGTMCAVCNEGSRLMGNCSQLLERDGWPVVVTVMAHCSSVGVE